jgi:hypothetical protein
MLAVSKFLLELGNVYYSREVNTWSKQMFEKLAVDPSLEFEKY